MAFQKGQRYVAAHRMADQRTPFDSERPQSVGYRVGQKFHSVDFAFHFGNAVARQVERDHAHAFVEQRYEFFPYQE